MNKFLQTTILTKFNPTPYGDLELENCDLNNLNTAFETLLDHSLAVVWCLFSKKASIDRLTIPQLSSALCFLKKIQINGKYTPDIKFCIELLEDILNKRQKEKTKYVDEQIQTIGKYSSCNKLRSIYLNKIPSYLDMIVDNREEVLKYIHTKNVLNDNCINGDKMNFLLWWRREQMMKIKHELQKLHTIEWLIEKVDPKFCQNSKSATVDL